MPELDQNGFLVPIKAVDRILLLKMKNLIPTIRTGASVLVLAASVSPFHAQAATFAEDVTFVNAHTPVIVLRDDAGRAKIAVSPAWQGRVLTSTAGGNSGTSFGWINRSFIAAGQLQPHINPYGGEDRFWLGPEGGQYSIFFAKGTTFDLANWFTPAPVDTLPFEMVKRSQSSATFRSVFAVTNYSGTRFDVSVHRQVRLLAASDAADKLGLKSLKGLSLVAYETINRITNEGDVPWDKAKGLLSVWILGMYNPSPATTIVVPINSGPESERGVKVTADYFGNIPPDRLVVKDDVIYFSGDGNFRSKIGINPKRSKSLLGSYDAANKVLTVVQFSQPEGVVDYVNSLWKIQDHPYSGDAANSYNDGVPSPGAKALGPFYEIESSSPAAALQPRQSLTHIHRTYHFIGNEQSLNSLALATFGVSLQEIQDALPKK